MRSQMIDGDTRLIGIIGNPLKHSISPIIHNHLLRSLELPYVYIPLACSSQDLPIVIKSMHVLNMMGANITIPHKSAVLPLCDELSNISKIVGAVNTLYFKNGRLHGTTTDGIGFLMALSSANYDINNSRVVILGNGGTARTIAMTIVLEKKVKSITIIGRDLDKIKTLVNDLNNQTKINVSCALFEKCDTYLEQCDILINTTPVGMFPKCNKSPLLADSFNSKMVVFDVIYNPLETQLIKDAKNAGCQTINGITMLLYQGLTSFEYWTDIKPDVSLIDIIELEDIVMYKKL